MSEALVIAAHGSRDESGVAEFSAFANAWQDVRSDRIQEAGFLEFARPTIGQAIDRAVERGARRVVVMPAMLMAAGHVKNDVPSEVQEARSRHPGVTLLMGRALDIHPALLELCHVRYQEAIAHKAATPNEETGLVLVGRGTADPDANANISRVSRFLWESYGVRFATVAFSGLAKPGVEEAIDLCEKIGLRRVVVQPYFLFDGVLLKRIYEAVARRTNSNTEVIATDHFRLHPLLIEAFEIRVHEAIHGQANMNCDLCKYRVRLIGREDEQGMPQAGNHLHVRAVDEDIPNHHRRPRKKPTEVLAAFDDELHPVGRSPAKAPAMGELTTGSRR